METFKEWFSPMTTYITFRHYILKKNFKNILLNLQYIFDCIIAQFQSESRFIGENTGGGMLSASENPE